MVFALSSIGPSKAGPKTRSGHLCQKLYFAASLPYQTGFFPGAHATASLDRLLIRSYRVKHDSILLFFFIYFSGSWMITRLPIISRADGMARYKEWRSNRCKIKPEGYFSGRGLIPPHLSGNSLTKPILRTTRIGYLPCELAGKYN